MGSSESWIHARDLLKAWSPVSIQRFEVVSEKPVTALNAPYTGAWVRWIDYLIAIDNLRRDRDSVVEAYEAEHKARLDAEDLLEEIHDDYIGLVHSATGDQKLKKRIAELLLEKKDAG